MLTNAQRAVPLHVDSKLSLDAHKRVEFLCATGIWSHAGFQSFMPSYGGWIGENLAKGFPDATSTVAALVASPTHYANIVDTNYKRIGVAHDCGITVELFSQ